jgi:hypothetical protein
LQYEVTQDTLNLSFPSALTLVGDATAASTSWPSSNPFEIRGADQGGCGSTATTAKLPAIGVTAPGTNDITDIQNALPEPDNYTGTLTTKDVESLSGSVPAVYQSVSSLEALLATVKNKANQFPTPTPPATAVVNSDISNPGTSTASQIIYVDGDLTLTGNFSGYGILVVTGTLTLKGNFSWSGAVLAIGKGDIEASGGGNGGFDGAVIVAATRDSSNHVQTSLGTPTFKFNGGGGNSIKYSAGCINKDGGNFTDFRILAARELARLAP